MSVWQRCLESDPWFLLLLMFLLLLLLESPYRMTHLAIWFQQLDAVSMRFLYTSENGVGVYYVCTVHVYLY